MCSMKALLFLILVLPVVGLSQTDSTEYGSLFPIKDGIYLSYQDFRHNKNVSKYDLVSTQDKDQLEFITKVLAAEKFSVKVNGTERVIQSADVYGYFQNNTFYINYKGEFYRVPVFGSISYLVAYVTVISPAFYDPRYALTSPATTSKELKEFLINFYDGTPVEFTMKAVEDLLGRDQVLYEEYMKLSNRKKKDGVYSFIRRYNSAHPIYFIN